MPSRNKFHEETVYDWDEVQTQVHKKQHKKVQQKITKKKSRSKSLEVNQNSNVKQEKRSKSIQLTNDESKKQLTNFPGPWGYATTPLRGPCNYLKKNEGVRIKKSPTHKCEVIQRKPGLPKQNEFQKFPKKEQKNFECENINMIKDGKITKKPITLKYVDTRTGTTHTLSNSGHVPEYIYSPNFGKVPKYVTKIKNLIAKYEKHYREQFEDKQNIPEIKNSLLKFISEEERLELLEGMKNNFKEILSTYQKLPVCIDTEPKRLRKSKLEKELNKLEKDIMFIESNPLIYVCENLKI